MSPLRIIIGLIGALALVACASSYGPSSMTGGFAERQLREGVWRVEYNGNGYTSEETVQTYWLYRSAELALEQGYDGFQIISNVELTALPDGEARIVPAVESGLGKPYMIADIQLLRAPLPPQGRHVFDARAMKAFLETYVTELCQGNVCPHVHRYLFPDFGAAPAPS